MRRFIICDDEPEVLQLVSGKLLSLYPECHIEQLSSAESLKFALRSGQMADVLLTDIELNGVSSIELIRDYLTPGSLLQIIYFTGYIAYCTQVYDTPHSSFLTKPVTSAALKKAVDRALASAEALQQDNIAVQIKNQTHILRVNELLYLESHGRYVTLSTFQSQLECFGRLDEFLQKLDGRFLQCHKSFVINMAQVRILRGDCFIMQNDKVIPVSQMRRRAVKEEFLRYVEGKA